MKKAGNVIAVAVVICLSILLLGLTASDEIGNSSIVAFFALRCQETQEKPESVKLFCRCWIAYAVQVSDVVVILLMLRWRKWKGKRGVAVRSGMGSQNTTLQYVDERELDREDAPDADLSRSAKPDKEELDAKLESATVNVTQAPNEKVGAADELVDL